MRTDPQNRHGSAEARARNLADLFTSPVPRELCDHSPTKRLEGDVMDVCLLCGTSWEHPNTNTEGD